MSIAFDQRVQKAVDFPATIREAVKEGLDFAWFDHLAALYDASGTAFARIVGIDTRTLSRRRREGKLTARESSSLYNLAVLYEHALEVLGDSEIVRLWFNTAAPAFAGLTPLELIDSAPGIKEVDNLLVRIEQGVFT
jgi:putative toxin-antitoxin system antitoxin component (TIGR02293 family)